MTAISTTATRRRATPEADIQRAIVALLRAVVPGAIVHHSNNSVAGRGRKSKTQGGILKGLGVHAGFADLVVIAQGIVVFLEVKSATGSLEASQRQFRDEVQAQGFLWALVRSEAEALAAVEAAGIRTRAVQHRIVAVGDSPNAPDSYTSLHRRIVGRPE